MNGSHWVEVDPITEDLHIGHSSLVEQFHWFIRDDLENAAGQLSTAGATSEEETAAAADADAG